MLPSEEEDFLDTRLVTQLNGGGYHRNGLNGHNSDSNVTGVGQDWEFGKMIYINWI